MLQTVMMVTQVTLFRLNSLVADRATYSGLLIIVIVESAQTSP